MYKKVNVFRLFSMKMSESMFDPTFNGRLLLKRPRQKIDILIMGHNKVALLSKNYFPIALNETILSYITSILNQISGQEVV